MDCGLSEIVNILTPFTKSGYSSKIDKIPNFVLETAPPQSAAQ